MKLDIKLNSPCTKLGMLFPPVTFRPGSYVHKSIPMQSLPLEWSRATHILASIKMGNAYKLAFYSTFARQVCDDSDRVLGQYIDIPIYWSNY